MSILAIAGLAVVSLSPGVMATFGADEIPAFSRPEAPSAAQPVAVSTAETTVLANWEYTKNKNPYGDAVQDVLQALAQVNDANHDAAKALLSNNTKQASRIDREAAGDVLRAYNQLAEAAGDARSSALLQDAVAMFNIYVKMFADAQAGNSLAVFQDSQQAQAIANKAVLDASPYK